MQFISQGILPIGPGAVLPVSGIDLVSAETVQLRLHGEGCADVKSKEGERKSRNGGETRHKFTSLLMKMTR